MPAPPDTVKQLQHLAVKMFPPRRRRLSLPTSPWSLVPGSSPSIHAAFLPHAYSGFQPPIPSEPTTELLLFFNGRDELQQVFTVLIGTCAPSGKGSLASSLDASSHGIFSRRTRSTSIRCCSTTAVGVVNSEHPAPAGTRAASAWSSTLCATRPTRSRLDYLRALKNQSVFNSCDPRRHPPAGLMNTRVFGGEGGGCIAPQTRARCRSSSASTRASGRPKFYGARVLRVEDRAMMWCEHYYSSFVLLTSLSPGSASGGSAVSQAIDPLTRAGAPSSSPRKSMPRAPRRSVCSASCQARCWKDRAEKAGDE
ncbi:hypothetical protein DFH09DRAFT_1357939 [Mycena vulgaris]|nr:hypothetical protein DFH09DRAFT_1357939 [Mycena vulgaris]